MAYGKSKHLAKGTRSNKVLRNKAFEIAINPKYNKYQRRLGSMLYKFFDKKNSGVAIKPEPNYQLVNELHRQFLGNLRKKKVYSLFRGNIWGVGLADMKSLSKYNKGVRYLFCAIDLFRKYAGVIPAKGITIAHAFQKKISKGRKPIKYELIKVVNFTIIFSKYF